MESVSEGNRIQWQVEVSEVGGRGRLVVLEYPAWWVPVVVLVGQVGPGTCQQGKATPPTAQLPVVLPLFTQVQEGPCSPESVNLSVRPANPIIQPHKSSWTTFIPASQKREL